MPRLAFIAAASTMLFATPLLAAASQPTFQCEIKDGGKLLRVWGANPTDKEAKCSVRCAYHQTDDKEFNLPCTATLPAKAADKPLCESHDAARSVDYVEGMGAKCN